MCGVPLLGHEAVFLATVISEPDLQKKVKNSVVLAKPVFFICVCACVCARAHICACVHTFMCVHKLLKGQRQTVSPLVLLGAGGGGARGEGTVYRKWNGLICFPGICRIPAGEFATGKQLL